MNFGVNACFQAKNDDFLGFRVAKLRRNVAKVVQNGAKVVQKCAKVVHYVAIFVPSETADFADFADFFKEKIQAEGVEFLRMAVWNDYCLMNND